MKNRSIILMFLVLSVLGFGAGYFILDVYKRLGDALFYGMGALAAVFLALLAVPNMFGAWKKFAIWFVPLAAVLFAFYGDPASGDLFSPYPEQVFKWVSGLYVLVSAGIIFNIVRKR